MAEQCGIEYVAPEGPRGPYGSPRPRCERPAGHRDDAVSVYQDPDGCHERRGLIWTRKHASSTTTEVSDA